ncbi:MAG: ABC transporter ATP-binding protein [Candidatus Enteromonas sp.]|nr:ABC transporter ATP-binding protein [Candidatus Enteromonas sp.]
MVFDDSLSAVDAQTDLAIRKRLKEEAKGVTQILITHRIATAKDADLILVMDHGKVVERGKHEDLLAAHGLYAEIASIQTSRKEVEA